MTLQENFSVFEYAENIPEEKLVDLPISYSFKWKNLSVPFFFEKLSLLPRMVWSQKDVLYAGSGAAVNLIATSNTRFKIIQQQLHKVLPTIISNKKQNPFLAPKFFGGFSFDTTSCDTVMWENFPPAYFILPKYQYSQMKNEQWLTVNLIKQKDEDNQSFGRRIVSEIDFLKQLLTDKTAVQVISGDNSNISISPEQSGSLITEKQWDKQVNDIVTNIRRGDLKKTVLSRIYHIKRQKKLDIITTLSKLEKKFPSCYIFFFEPLKDNYFFGASPELLVNAVNNSIEVHALAGSNKRGKTQQEDKILGNELLNTPKERAEHTFVIEQISQKLAPFTKDLKISDEPTLLKLQNIQHLKTIIRGELINKGKIIPVVEALHPTPAVGGVPQEEALKIIKDLEIYSRGWYASPVGWVNQHGDGTFVVAIRSAIVNKNDIWLYAGAGIVNGSRAEKEWQETQLKFSALLDVLES